MSIVEADYSDERDWHEIEMERPATNADRLLTLWDTHVDCISALLMTKGVNDANDRADILQDAFVQAMLHFDQLQDEDHFRSWVGTIASNTLTSTMRRAITRKASKHTSLREDLTDSDLFHSGLTPPAIVIQKEEWQRMMEAIDRLKAKQRDAIRCHYFEYMELDEIAEMNDEPVGTIKNRLHKARKKLSQLLREGESGVAA